MATKQTSPKARSAAGAGPSFEGMVLVQSQVLPLSALEPNDGQVPGIPKNPRICSREDARKLKQSIQDDAEMMTLREILVLEHAGKYVIIAGNMRYKALKELGYKDAICKVIPAGTTPEKIKAYLIKDNNSYGEWNVEDLANSWDLQQLIEWGVKLPDLDTSVPEDEAQEDNFNVADELTKKATANFGDVYRLGRHRLICGDSTDPAVAKLLMGGTEADLILTDPPYNVDYSAKNEVLNKADKGNRIQKDIANDKMTREQFGLFLRKAFENMNSVAKAGAAIYIFYASREAINFIEAMEGAGFSYKQQLIWVKNNMVLGLQDYQWKHEPILYGWKEGAPHYFADRRDQLTVYEDAAVLDLEAMSKAELKKALKDIIEASQIPNTAIHENKPQVSSDHPTMKPVKLVGRLIKNSTKPGEIVVDLFGGSGSTLIAADQLGRRCFTVELDPCYIDVIIKRWEKQSGEKAELIGNYRVGKE